MDELDLLQSSTAAQLSTSLIIFPKGASLFNEFLDFVAQCDFILEDLNLAGEFINITFHPSFKFEDTFDNERINYVNRSPYPMIHLIRSSEIEIATKSIKQGEDINKTNDLLLTSLSDTEFENNILSLLSKH